MSHNPRLLSSQNYFIYAVYHIIHIKVSMHQTLSLKDGIEILTGSGSVSHTSIQMHVNARSKHSVTLHPFELLSPTPLIPLGTLANFGACQPKSCQSHRNLTNLLAHNGLKGNEGSFLLCCLIAKISWQRCRAHGKPIYTWHLLTECAYWLYFPTVLNF